MTPDTIRRLNQLNLDFYHITAAHFSVTRSHPWEGWQKLVAPISAVIERLNRPVRVLDLGCGNGRFATWLSQTWPTTYFAYHGVDGAEQLLKECQSLRLPFVHVTTHQHDIVEALLQRETFLSERTFDLVVAFGVVHHLPGDVTRQRFFELLRRKLTKSGLAVVSVWQFDHLPQLLERQREPREFDLSELDKGDFLLDWQRGVSAVRYCHLLKKAAAKQLVEESNLHLRHSFSADGSDDETNLYLLLEKSTGP